MTIKGKPKIAKNHPKTGLIRFEFIELMWRLALKRFYETKEADSESSAVELLLKKHIFPNCSQFNSQSFRDSRYWNEDCDYLYKSHYSLFDHIYTIKGGSHRLPGEKMFMAFDEFLNIFTESNLMNDQFPERDVITSFNLSIMTQVDELHFDRHMKMQFVEFLEAIARAAELLSLPPQDGYIVNLPYICIINFLSGRRMADREKTEPIINRENR